ncbi:unnamed protein product [Peniophora sp. CBMAI 1063]|nr:unnamed protein product [Peniophora sp. CBMAI 1063]
MIFLYFPAIPTACVQRPNTTLPNQGAIPDLTWLHVTHVCRRWRSISLGCPIIWTSISFKPPCSTPRFLERARQAPLDIDVDWKRDGSRHYIDDVVALALEHLSHTRLVRLSNPPAGFVERMVAAFGQQGADLLEHLHLSNVEEQKITLGASISTIELPDRLFARPTSRLRRLIMNGRFRITWRSQLFASHLTHLCLAISDSASVPTMDELLSCLRACPLEVLLLHGCLPRHATQTPVVPLPDGHPFVDIPTLRVIRLSDLAVNVANLLRRLHIPADCRVELGNQHEPHSASAATTEALATEVDHVLSRSSYASQDLSLQVMQYRPYNCTWTLSKLKTESSGSSGDASGYLIGPRSFTLTLESQMRPTTFEEHIRNTNTFSGALIRISPLYHLGSVRILSIQALNPLLITRESWVVLLRELRRLEIIQVSGHCSYTFGLAFALLAPDQQIAPYLRQIDIRHAHFGYPLGPSGLSIQLENAFHMRNEVGALRPNVEFWNCRISPAQLFQVETALGGRVLVTGDPETWGVGDNANDADLEG